MASTTNNWILLAPYLLNWPVLGFILAGLFIWIFNAEIRTLLSNSTLPESLLGNSQQAKNIASNSKEGPESIQAAKHDPDYQMMFLSLALVPSTQKNLHTLLNFGALTETEFKENMTVSSEAKDIDGEKEAMIKALLKFDLVDYSTGKYKVTSLGKKFLKYRGFVVGDE